MKPFMAVLAFLIFGLEQIILQVFHMFMDLMRFIILLIVLAPLVVTHMDGKWLLNIIVIVVLGGEDVAVAALVHG